MNALVRISSAVLLYILNTFVAKDRDTVRTVSTSKYLYELRYHCDIRTHFNTNFLEAVQFRLTKVFVSTTFSKVGIKQPSISIPELPRSVTYLKIGFNYFNETISPHVIPDSITSLDLGSSFNQPVLKGVLPPRLKFLTFGPVFRQTLQPGIMPQTLTELLFGKLFNSPILEGVLPPNLQRLTFGESFNQPISQNVLPNSLTHLEFGYNFNQLIGENVLPSSLISLRFGAGFNQPFSTSTLPQSLLFLKLDKRYQQPLALACLPLSIIQVTLICNMPYDYRLHDDSWIVKTITALAARKSLKICFAGNYL